MTVLSINYIISLVLSLFSLSSPRSSKIVSLWIFVLVFLVHAFVDIDSVPDLYGYSLGFKEVSNMSLWQCLTTDVEICKMERGFALLLKLFSSAGLNFRCFLIVNAAIISILFYKGVVRYSSSTVLSSLLFLVTINSQSIYILRQYLVMAVFFYSFRWVIEKKMIHYVITCVICFFIHQSAIILIPIYFLYNLSPKKMALAILVLGLFLRVGTQLLVDYFGATLVGYGQYLAYDGADGQNTTEFIIKIVYLMIFVIFLKKDIFKEGINRLILICVLLNCLLSFFGIGYGFMGRLVLYFSSVHILLIPQVLNSIRNKIIKGSIVVGCVSLNTYIAFWGAIATEVSKIELMSLF